MTPKEQFNIVIKCIEEMVEGKKNEETGFVEYYSDAEIVEKAFKDVPISPATRDKNAIFAFLTKKTPLQYITERRMMAAYQYLINKGRFTINEEIAITNLSSQASFNRKFKTFFPDMTPKDAFFFHKLTSFA